MKRQFLGNSQPLLHLTAKYLIDRYHKEEQLNLRNVILVFQEKQAAYRLEEILVQKAEKIDPAWYPPKFLTIGALPERFYKLRKPLADDLTQCFAWLAAIDRLDDEYPDLLHRIIPAPPKRNDLDSRLALGKMFAMLHWELAADTLDFIHVAELCRKLNIDSETERWQALATLQEKYHAKLDTLGIWDKQSARLFALEKPEEFDVKRKQFQQDGTEILLVGVADMNVAQKDMLRHFHAFVTPLVFAPENWADRFDDFGCLIPHVWQDVHIKLDDSQIRIVESPDEQAEEVLRCLSNLQGKYAPPEIIVGVPDQQVVPFIERRFEQADIVSRLVDGKPIQQTSVYRFLETLLLLLETPSFANFAALVRHPAVETYLQLQIESREHNKVEQPDAEVPAKWTLITELDRYHSKHFPSDWTAVDHSEPLRAVRQELQKLIESGDLAGILATIFSDKDRDESYGKILTALLEIQQVPAELMPELPFADTIRLVLTQVIKEKIPFPHDSKAVDLVDWLYLAMDDAEVIIVTGMNDGKVPAFKTSDMFLPDTMRRNLAIEDNNRRYARDAYALTCLLATRQYDPHRVQLIGSRRSGEGDPLLPSRLFFADADAVIAKRVKRFFAEEREALPHVRFLAGQKPDVIFEVPKVPDGIGKTVTKMNVTDFAKYKRCPYRFYLERCVEPKLESLHDADTELPPRTFGTLIHNVLERFGKTDAVKHSTDADVIRDFLVSAVRELTCQQYGDRPLPVIAIQVERAIKRLEAFADWQADWAVEYEILATELSFSAEQFFLDVVGDKMPLSGQIDRIDRNKKTGALVILDNKTRRSAHPKQHLKGGEWIDFQLPLYYHLLGRHEEYVDYLRRGFQLGYIVLPSDVKNTGVKLADWNESAVLSALDGARAIVECIWRDEFPMASPSPPFSEAFAAICQDF